MPTSDDQQNDLYPVKFSFLVDVPSPDIDPKGREVVHAKFATRLFGNAIPMLAPLIPSYVIEMLQAAHEAGHLRCEIIVGDVSVKMYIKPETSAIENVLRNFDAPLDANTINELEKKKDNYLDKCPGTKCEHITEKNVRCAKCPSRKYENCTKCGSALVETSNGVLFCVNSSCEKWYTKQGHNNPLYAECPGITECKLQRDTHAGTLRAGRCSTCPNWYR